MEFITNIIYKQYIQYLLILNKHLIVCNYHSLIVCNYQSGTHWSFDRNCKVKSGFNSTHWTNVQPRIGCLDSLNPRGEWDRKWNKLTVTQFAESIEDVAKALVHWGQRLQLNLLEVFRTLVLQVAVSLADATNHGRRLKPKGGTMLWSTHTFV